MSSIDNSIIVRPSDNHGNGDREQQPQPTVYKQRWLILFTLSWLNFTNGVLWISYSSTSDVVRDFYNVSLAEVNYLSLSFPVVTIALGLPAIWGVGVLGLRLTCITCGWLNLCSALFRFASSDVTVALKLRYPLAMTGQILGAAAQPLAMFSPARLAALWFPADQRAIATTLGALGNPLGILIGTLVPPFVPNSSNQTMFQISIGILIIAVISALLPTLSVNRSEPRSPPAIAVDRPWDSYTLREQLRLCFTNVSFIILTLSFGVGLGIFTALSTLFEQIFCPFGYDDRFAGVCGGLLIGCGIVGSFVSGLVADKIKVFIEIIQFCFVNTTFGIIAFSIVTNFSGFDVYIAIAVCYIGTFGVALYSIALELAAEITFPVSENISSGLLVVSGQIFSVLFILLSQILQTPIEKVSSNIVIKCSTVNGQWNQNFWPFNVFMSSTAVVGSSVMLLFFRGQYRRRLMEGINFSVIDSDVDSLTQ